MVHYGRDLRRYKHLFKINYLSILSLTKNYKANFLALNIYILSCIALINDGIYPNLLHVESELENY